MTDTRDEDEDKDEDPVTAEYDVFITPDLIEKLYLLQYPNRNKHQPYSDAHGTKILEMRIKPDSGFMEMDTALNTGLHFDKLKGLQWGDAIRSAKSEGPNAFGMAGGFQPAFKNFRTNPDAQRDDDQNDGEQTNSRLGNFETAVNNGHVMNKQTLGGQIIWHQPGMPIYMLGAFRGSENIYKHDPNLR